MIQQNIWDLPENNIGVLGAGITETRLVTSMFIIAKAGG